MNKRVEQGIKIVGGLVLITSITGVLPLGILGILIGVYLLSFDTLNPYISKVVSRFTE